MSLNELVRPTFVASIISLRPLTVHVESSFPSLLHRSLKACPTDEYRVVKWIRKPVRASVSHQTTVADEVLLTFTIGPEILFCQATTKADMNSFTLRQESFSRFNELRMPFWIISSHPWTKTKTYHNPSTTLGAKLFCQSGIAIKDFCMSEKSSSGSLSGFRSRMSLTWLHSG